MEAKKLILVIDDEAEFIETMKFFLENSNFRVTAALTSEDGLKQADELKPDLIFIDQTMREMDGFEITRQLKRNILTSHIPIIMLSAKDKSMDKFEVFNLGATDFIGKQFSYEEMLARIKAVLKENSSNTITWIKEEKDKRILELRKILEEKKIRVLFQPIVSLSSRKPIGYEALMRGPEGSRLENPLELLALSAEANALFEIHMTTLSLAAQNAKLMNHGLLLFLNIDPRLIATDYFKNLEFLKDSNIRPDQVCFEITERTYIKNFTRLSSDLGYFKSKGVKIGLDDVGEGYASLKAIAELKPEFIKVDMDLVRNINSDEVKNILMRVIIELAKKINTALIAEGIETEEEKNTLIASGVEYGQGFLFALPSENIDPLNHGDGNLRLYSRGT